MTIGTGSSATGGTTTLQAKGALNLTSAAASTFGFGANTLGITSSNFNVSTGGALNVVGGSAGFQIGGAATTGNYLRGNGTSFVSSAIQASDIPDLSASYIKNQTSQQASSNFNISGTGVAGVALQAPLLQTADVASGTSAALMMRSGNGTAGGAGSGNVTIDTGSKNGGGLSGNVYVGDTNALNVNIGRNSSSNVALTVMGTAATSSLIFSNAANTAATTITVTTPTSTRAISFPDAGGAVCLDSGNCGGATGYILNQSTADQTASFRITGTGRANTSILTPLLDTPSGTTTLNIGTTNATVGINLNQSTTILSGKNLTVAGGGLTQSGGAVGLTANAASSFTTSSGALTLTSAAAATWSTAAGDLAVTAGANLSLGAAGGTINAGSVGTAAAGTTVHVADTTDGTNVQAVTIGSTANASNAVTLRGGSGASGGVVLQATTVALVATNLQFAQGGARNILVAQAASGAGNSLTIAAGQSGSGANNGGNLVLQAGATGGSGTTGSVVVKANGTDSTSAFDVQNSSGVSQLTVDTTNSKVILPTAGVLQANNLIPTATLSVGAAAQALSLLGTSATTLAVTSGANTLTVNFAAPTVNGAVYQFAAPTTASTTYTICTSDLNSCGNSATGYLRKGVANETSSANLTAGQLLYTFSNSSSTASGVLKIDNGGGTGSALSVVATTNPASNNALIYAKLTNASVGGNLLDLWGGASGSETSKLAVDATGNVVQAGGVSTTTTVNGQRISSAANFTGTVTAATSFIARFLTPRIPRRPRRTRRRRRFALGTQRARRRTRAT